MRQQLSTVRINPTPWHWSHYPNTTSSFSLAIASMLNQPTRLTYSLTWEQVGRDPYDCCRHIHFFSLAHLSLARCCQYFATVEYIWCSRSREEMSRSIVSCRQKSTQISASLTIGRCWSFCTHTLGSFSDIVACNHSDIEQAELVIHRRTWRKRTRRVKLQECADRNFCTLVDITMTTWFPWIHTSFIPFPTK